MSTLKITSPLGEFSILLHNVQAPKTCQYFTELVRGGAYKHASIFRIVSAHHHQLEQPNPIQVVQMGPPPPFTGDSFADDAFASDGLADDSLVGDNLVGDRHSVPHEGTNLTGLSHRKWTVSAARFDLGELYGSFFICMRDEPELDWGGSRQSDGQGFAAFGRVISGFETMETIYQHAEADEILVNKIPIEVVLLGDNETSSK